MRVQLKNIFPKLTNKQITIYNPIDFENIEKLSEAKEELPLKERKLLDSKYICSVGRLDEGQKDFTTLIKVYSNLVKKGIIEEKLVIVGDGPHKNSLETLVKDLNVEKEVIFLGKKSNPYIWIKNSKLFILSSKYEGFPTVLIEALVLNVPTVSSNCLTGPKEILETGKYGKLFEVGNEIELERMTIDVLNNPNYIKTREYIKEKFGKGFENLEKIMR